MDNAARAHAYNHKRATQAKLLNNDAESHHLCRKEIKAVERATGARLGKTCGVDGDDDDGDDDAAPAGFGVGHASYKAAFPGAGPGGK